MYSSKSSLNEGDDDINLAAIVQHKPNLSRKLIGSNWSAVQNNLSKNTNKNNQKVKESQKNSESFKIEKTNKITNKKAQKQDNGTILSHMKNSNCIAIDCEMVGIGKDGQKHMLARVSIVNENGMVILDKYVKPTETVTDYRTPISGIRAKDIEGGEDFETVQKEIINLIKGKILVGHALKNDFEVLKVNHPRHLIRDTARCSYVKRLVQNKRTPSLKWLACNLLGEDIQKAEHDSIEDARAVMRVYLKIKQYFEKEMKTRRYKKE